MNITTSTAAAGVYAKKAADAPKKEYQVKSEQRNVADRYEDSRKLGNGVAGLVTGATVETLDAAVKAFPLAGSVIKNLWKAETIGRNLKTLGIGAALLGLPSAASIIAAPFYGGFKGASLARQAGRASEEVLPKDAAPEYTNRRFNGGEDSKSLSSSVMESLDELGAKKLEPGEKKFDVPILAPASAVVGAVVSGAISGVVGLVAGLGAGLLTTFKEVKGGIQEGKIGRVIASPLHIVAIPYGLIKEGLKESVPRGFVDGFKHGFSKPIIDTTKASVTLAGSVLKEAWNR